MVDHDLLSHSCCTSSKEADSNIYHFQPRRIHYQTPITPSWCNISSTFSSLSSTLIPPHKRDQIYSRRCSGICSMEDIQGLFTCWLAMKRLEKRLSFVKWSAGKTTLGVFGENAVAPENVHFSLLPKFVQWFLTLMSKNSVPSSDMLSSAYSRCICCSHFVNSTAYKSNRSTG